MSKQHLSTDHVDLLAMASHEIRTPLNALLGFARLLERDRIEPLTPRQNQRVRQLIVTGEHLLRLANDLLDLSIAEGTPVSVRIARVNLKEVIDRVCTLLEPVATAHDVRITPVESPAASQDVLADPLRLEQVLLNLGSNAIKYNRREGTVRVDVAVTDGEHVRVAVTDTGIGVPFDRQPLVFGAFERAGQEGGPVEGTGLGLTISRKLVEMMGGEIGFTSTPGVGSTFWTDLRLATGPPQHADH